MTGITLWRRWCLQLTLVGSVIVGWAITKGEDGAFAQITPDTTLPNNSTIITQDNASLIEGGTKTGGNLLHSFEQFSVPTGYTAHFNNAADVQNIISRVTGLSISNIDGLIRANASANLFLLNPNGIIFGPNASLNIGGSFIGSTASSLKFADGTQFSATDPQATPLLTVSIPIGLQYGGTAGNILNQSKTTNGNGELVGLQVQPGKTLALVGGDIALEGGGLTAADGRISLLSVAGGPGLVSLNPADKGWSLRYEGAQNFQDIRLSKQAIVVSSGLGSGDIQLLGRGVTLTEDSGIIAQNLGSQSGGNISIRAEQLNIDGASFVDASTLGSGRGGNVTIETGKLMLQSGGTVSAGAFGPGQGGNLVVTASDSVELIGTLSIGQTPRGLLARFLGEGAAGGFTINQLFSNLSTPTIGTGAAGDLTINTGKLIVQGGALISTGPIGSFRVQDGRVVSFVAFGQGQGGSVAVTASEFVKLMGTSPDGQVPSGLFNQTLGNSATGDLRINTGKLVVQNGAVVSTANFGQGQGRTLVVAASDSVEIIGTSPKGQIPSSLLTQTQGAGAAGNLTIATGKLIIQDAAVVSTATLGPGPGGNLAVTASEFVKLTGISSDGQLPSGLYTTQVNPEGGGNGGNLTVETGRLIIRNGAQVSTQTRGAGNAGDLTIKTGQLTVQNEAGVNVSSTGAGDAGNLNVRANSIRLDNQALLSSNTSAGQGNIFLDSQNLLLRRSSNITTNATGSATGGNITIKTNVLAALENSDISANAEEAFGGRVLIDAQGIFGTEFRQAPIVDTSESDITATSRLGSEFSGTVEINTPDVDLNRGLVNLPTQPTDTQVVQACQPGGSQAQSKFVVTGRGGLPPTPGEALSTDAVQVNLMTLNPEVAQPSTHKARGGNRPASATFIPSQLVEAQGWIVNAKGQLVLTISALSATPNSFWSTSSTCNALYQNH